MGEYAIRKSDGQEIKIGTCSSMYYLRHSDIDKIQSLKGNVDVHDQKTLNELRFRLPFPDEDTIKPGNYEPSRGVKLYNYSNPETIDDPGIVQVSTKYGMLVNLPCYHGEKLPESTKDIHFFWNGKGPAYELHFLKFIDGEPWGVYECIGCKHSWRAPLKEIITFMGGDSAVLRNRLIEWYCPDLFKKSPEVS